MSHKQEVSVLMPCYNRASFMKKSLSAVRDSLGKKGELIVVDDGSQDNTGEVAKEYADKIVRHRLNLGLPQARKSGIRESKGEILVHIDSDVLVSKYTIPDILNHFQKNPETVALTGLLSKQHPNPDFFSQYKNLYMHYSFGQLPKSVKFVYGSIFAMKREVAHLYEDEFKYGEDTAFGQRLAKEGKKVAFLKNLEVIHLKKYNFFSLIKNDFLISFNWAKIFWKFNGLKQLGKDGTGFAHASKRQLVSLVIAPLTLIFVLSMYFIPSMQKIVYVFSLFWLLTNLKFFIYLKREKGFWFSLCSIFITFLDQLVMIAGVVFGTLKYFRS